MAVKKPPAAKKGKRKKKTSPRAPGKADPLFFTRLSRAVREEFDSAAATKKPASTRTEETAKSPEPEERPPRKTRAGVPETSQAKKSPAAASQKNKGKVGKDSRELLKKELKSLLEELDEEGLEFLLEQGRVHRYNMEVERLNDSMERSAERKTSRASGKNASPSKAAPRPPALRIERSQDGNTYHVVSGGRYKMFSAEEMLSLVRIAHANPDSFEAGRGLHRWMARERMDAISDLGISGPSDPSLSTLAELLRKSFAKPASRG